MSLQDKIDLVLWRISEAIAEHDPVAVYALCSGGHDSLVLSDIAAQHPSLTAVVHINTGIGIEEGRNHLRSVAEERGWPFREYSHDLGNHPGPTYEEIILKHGFPGPGAHLYAYTLLKERVINKLVRDSKSHRMDRVLLLTGVRLDESERRMGNVEPLTRAGAKVWAAPILDWTNKDKNEYLAEYEIPRNPVNDKMHYSGECLCGAFARPGEIEELKFWYPEVAERIHDLEHKAKAAGVPCVWGTRPPGKRQTAAPPLPMCVKCESWGE